MTRDKLQLCNLLLGSGIFGKIFSNKTRSASTTRKYDAR
jgi:hypothetical protein